MNSKKALVVIDVQSALCVGESASYKAGEVISNINALIGKAREAEVPIIFIQHQAREGVLAKGEDGWKLAQALDVGASDILVDKSASDAFKGTTLKQHLEEMKVNHLVVCGMQSEFCVDSTIRRALALSYAITVVADGHTTEDNDVIPAATISKHHNSTWENITSYDVRATAMNTNQIIF